LVEAEVTWVIWDSKYFVDDLQCWR